MIVEKKSSLLRLTALSTITMLLSLFVIESNTNYQVSAQTTDQIVQDTIRFYNINMPATATVGKNFTLTGSIVSDTAQTMDHLYLTIQNNGHLWIYGDKTVDLGYFVAGTTSKNFSFKIRPLQDGPFQITLNAIGVQNNFGVKIKGTTSINSSAIADMDTTQSSPQLMFTRIDIPSDIVSGKEALINYTVINKGSFVANDVIVTLSPPSGILIKGDAVYNVGNLLPGRSVSSTFKVIPIDSGSFKMNLAAFSSNNPTSLLPITLTVAESNTGIALTSLTTSPSNIYPGDISDKINIGISNFNQQDLRGLMMNLVLPEGISFATSGYNSHIFSYLPSAPSYTYDVEQIAPFSINVDRNIQPGTHVIGLLFNGDGLSNYSLPLPITISPKAYFELQNVTYSTTTLLGTQSQNSLSPGVTTVVRVTLKNAGTAPAQSVVGTLQVSNDFQGIKNTGVVNVGVVDRAGQILPNQIFHLTFTLDVDPTSQAGTYPGTISLGWQQGQLIDNFSQSVPLTIPVTPTPVFYSIPYLQLFLAGTSGLFLILYLLARRKKAIEEEKKTAV